jgi:hypothetical protein
VAKQPTILEILDRLEPTVRAAFLQSVQAVANDTQLAVLVAAIERGDVQAALAALRLGPEYFNALDRAIRAAYIEGGEAAIAAFLASASAQGVGVVARFNERNVRAEAYLSQHAATMVQQISESVRATVRQVILDSAQVGTSSRTTALNIVGRINRATGNREGGVIGLTRSQAAWLSNPAYRRNGTAPGALEQLISGDPSLMRSYLTRRTRDRRFDRAVLAAIREDRVIPTRQARAMVRAMQTRVLRMRGETIARTELHRALHASQDEAMWQTLDEAGLRPDAATGIWDASEDKATRPSHADMDMQRRQGNEPFRSGDGNLMRYPGDAALGAPASDIINCRCIKRVDIDFLSGLQ